MSVAKWTSGPWNCTTRQGSWDWVVFQVNNPNIEVCQPFHDGTELNERGEANAHLIAAAPELYQAAELAERNMSGQPSLSDIEKTVKALRAALKKARGES